MATLLVVMFFMYQNSLTTLDTRNTQETCILNIKDPTLVVADKKFFNCLIYPFKLGIHLSMNWCSSNISQ